MIQRLQSLPNTPGVGFKPQHFDDILSGEQPIGFIEVHAENYMGAGGPPHAMLRRLRETLRAVHSRCRLVDRLDGAARYRTSCRGSRALCDRYEPESFSEHLAWSSHGDVYLNDLLPLPYTPETLARIVDHVDQVQHTLEPRNAAGKSVDLYPVRRHNDSRSRIPCRDRAPAPAADCCSISTTSFVQANNHGTSARDYLDDFFRSRA